MNKTALLISIAAALLGTAVVWRLVNIEDNTTTTSVAPAPTASYGEQLIRHTSLLMGSGLGDAARQSGNNLDCSSCHLDSGRLPGMLSLLQSAAKYPTFSARDGIEGDLADRINGCMQRSMNGKALAKDSVEMQAMVNYVEELGRQYLAMSETKRAADEPPAFKEPNRQADVQHGSEVYQTHCALCHGKNGEGLLATTNRDDGYLFPPLWGPDSYNIGAGMARVLTAARFIKTRMPLGKPSLTDDETFDVAAYMNLQQRPGMANLDQDYPERARKPVDSPYPPYADAFSEEQHRVGPYAPIRDFYENKQ